MILRLPFVACAIASLFQPACGKKDDGARQKRIETLQAELHRAQARETALQGDVTKLTQQVARLQNDFKLYSQRPCDFALDPSDYSIKKKEEDPRPVSESPNGMRPARRSSSTNPGGPPSELSDVSSRIRQARRGFKTCYQEAAKKNASLQTTEKRVQLVFDVRPTGKVTGVMISPPVGYGFETCVRKLLSSWRFSKFQGKSERFRAWMNLRPH